MYIHMYIHAWLAFTYATYSFNPPPNFRISRLYILRLLIFIERKISLVVLPFDILSFSTRQFSARHRFTFWGHNFSFLSVAHLIERNC